MEDMPEYLHCLDEIAITNHIEDADPETCIKLPEFAKQVPAEEERQAQDPDPELDIKLTSLSESLSHHSDEAIPELPRDMQTLQDQKRAIVSESGEPQPEALSTERIALS